MCPRGGHVVSHHNEVCDLPGELMKESCHTVSHEPPLLPLSGEQLRYASTNTSDDAQLDFKAIGFWSGNRFENAFFDVRVFYPYARSYCNLTSDCCYRQCEQQEVVRGEGPIS